MPNTLFRKHRRQVNAPLSHLLTKQSFLVIAIFLLTIGFAHAQVQPALTAVFPQGGQQGRSVEVRLTGTNLGTATAVWFSGKGITAEIKETTGQAAVVFNGVGVSGSIPTDAQLVASLTIARRTVRCPTDTRRHPIRCFQCRQFRRWKPARNNRGRDRGIGVGNPSYNGNRLAYAASYRERHNRFNRRRR